MTHPEGFGQEPTDSAFFQKLEDELDGADERAEATYLDGLKRTVASQRDLIEKLMPGLLADSRFTPIKYPSYANGGILAEDGQPLLYTLEDVDAVAKERPDFAEIITRKARMEQLAERQQLAIDFELAQGDEEALEALAERKNELDYEVGRIRFWSAVALLHPFNTQEMGELFEEEYSVSTRWPDAVDFDSRVYMLLGIEKKRSLLEDENIHWSPAYLSAYKEAHGHDPVQKRYVDDRRERAEQNAVENYRLYRFQTAVLSGRLTTETPDFERPIADHDVVLTDEQKRIKSLPGLDPVMLTFNEMLKDIPQNGWLIVADRIKPGVQGGVTIWRYTEGGFRATGGANHDLIYGQSFVHFELKGRRSASTQVAYERTNGNVSYDNCTYTPSKYKILPDDNGNHFRWDADPPRAYPNGGTYGANFYSYDIEQRKRTGKARDGIAAVRATASPEEAKTIMSELLDVVGAGSERVAQVIAGLEENDVFGDLKVQTPEERDKLEALLAAQEQPKSCNCDECADPTITW
jgi:hypothetical protein